MFEQFGMEPCSGSFGSTSSNWNLLFHICSLSPTWDDYPIWFPYRDGNPATGLWTCPGAQEGLRQKRLAGYRQGALLENDGKTSCCKGFKRETWETLSMKHGAPGISMGKNDGNDHTPWDRAIETGCCEFRALGALLSQPAESVAWYTLGLPNAAGVTWLYQLLGVSPMSPIRRGNPSGLTVMGPGFATIPGSGNMWKCRTDCYSMIRYQYGTMCAEFRGSSAISHLHHFASAGCTDIFVHSHHCVGGVSFPRVASGHHFQHICRVKNMTWGELRAPF